MYARILQQSFRRQRRRKSLALLAVTAGMAAATAMLTLRVSLGDDLNAELRHIGANLVVTPAADSLPVTLNGVDLRPAGTGALLPEGEVPRIETIFWANNITAFAPILDTPARIGSQSVAIEGTYFAHSVTAPGGGRTVISGARSLNPAWSVTGLWPQDGTRQALAGVALAERLRLAVGDTIPVAGQAGPPLPLRITGLLSTGAAQDEEIVAPLTVAQSLAEQPGHLRQILVAAITKPEDAFARRNPAHMTPADAERWMCSPYALTIAHQLQQALPGSAVRVIRPVAESEGAILTQLRLLIWFLTALALAASALAIGAAMTAAVLERGGEIALMKAIGASDAAIGALFLGEAVLLGGGGGVAGFLAGQWLAKQVAVQVIGHAIAWTPALAPVMLLLAAAVTAAGCLHPLRLAMRLDPAPLLQGER